MEKIVVIVEDVEVAKTALQWALHNILRYDDLVTLLHVYSSSNNQNQKNSNPTATSRKKKLSRRLRLKGFQLALSFRDICTNSGFPNTKTEILVTEGEEEGGKIAAVVREIGASTLVLGLHDQSFLYKLVLPQNNITRDLRCKILAIKGPTSLTSRTISIQQGNSTNMDFSQIEIATLSVERCSIPEVHPQRIPYQICPDPNAIVWRSRPSRTTTPTPTPTHPSQKIPCQICPDPSAIIWRSSRLSRPIATA